MTLKTSAERGDEPRKASENQAASPAVSARRLIRAARKAALGTLDKSSGHPHVSLVTVATTPEGVPVLLISRLAVHTQNLMADGRASLLFDGTDLKGDPLAGGRVTLVGRAVPSTDDVARRRFLAKQPEAAGYADFADFSFYVLEVDRAHYIGGFGRIVTMPAAEVLCDTAGAEALIAGEADIVEHMNEDHADAVQLYASVLAGAGAGEWRMTGVDPEGCDLAETGGASVRVTFDARVSDPQEARRALVKLVQRARAGQAPAQGV
jgi:putative heme iron utilization protein